MKSRVHYGAARRKMVSHLREKGIADARLLAAMAEAAWFSGVTVVAAAGNDGPDGGAVATPGADPFVIALAEMNGCAVVTDENLGTEAKPHIPYVCRVRRIKALTVLELIQAEGWVI